MCCLLLPRNTPPQSNSSMWWSKRDPALTLRGRTHVRSQGRVRPSKAYLLHAKQAEKRGPRRHPGVTSRGRVRDYLSDWCSTTIAKLPSLCGRIPAISRSLTGNYYPTQCLFNVHLALWATQCHCNDTKIEQTIGHAEKADGCSTNQPLSATPASQDYQRVVEVNLSPRPTSS
jgi:hypothetical protein